MQNRNNAIVPANGDTPVIDLANITPPWRRTRTEPSTPPVPWLPSWVDAALRLEAVERERSWREGFERGYHDGLDAGYRRAYEEIEEHWAMVARNIRAHVGRPSYSERRRRELEWARPKVGDFTGRLTPAEYFGGAE